MKEAVETMMRYLDIEVENKMATARRLINTEMAYFTSEAQKMSYKELGCEQYEIVATLDGKTSHICQDMDGKVFDIKDFTAGITAPPFHPNCRSTTCPYFDDEFTEGETRAAKSETGITFKVPSDMTYAEWKRMVENNKRELYNILKGLRIATGVIKTINKHFIDRAIERKVNVEDIKDALVNPITIGDVELNDKGKPSVEYSGRKAVVQVNPVTNTLITTWKMSRSKLKKILQELK
jgi:SPP1 gp7 family putative phage head morphogenesis protein